MALGKEQAAAATELYSCPSSAGNRGLELLLPVVYQKPPCTGVPAHAGSMQRWLRHGCRPLPATIPASLAWAETKPGTLTLIQSFWLGRAAFEALGMLATF